jgi:hypothetical protein
MRIPTILLGLTITAASLLISCTAQQRQDFSHWKSDVIGLKRKITLYAASGTPIQSWEGRYKIEIQNGVARFLHEGKAVIISGTFIIEEK